MVMTKGRNAIFWEADCYLQKAQDAISRSLHELASVTVKEDNWKTKSSCRERQSSIDLRPRFVHVRDNSPLTGCLHQHNQINLQQSFSSNDDKPAGECRTLLRRKRFTRRQKRNLKSENSEERSSKSTLALNRASRPESPTSSSNNDDDDNDNRRLKQPAQLTTTRNGETIKLKTAENSVTKVLTTPSRFFSSRQNYGNSDLITKSVTEIVDSSPSTQSLTQLEGIDTFQKFKGPTARKAHRRTLRSKLNSVTCYQQERKASSHARLDFLAHKAELLKTTVFRRSLSVRELNGTMIDFTNQDSVTRWTSQILAELNSLPSSRFDLTEQQTSATFQNENAIIETNPVVVGTIIDNGVNIDVTPFNKPEEISSKKFSEKSTELTSESTSDISIEMGSINSSPSSLPRNDECQSPATSKHHSFEIFSKSYGNDFTKSNENKFCERNIAQLPEVSCTADIVLMALQSNRHNQSADAVIVNVTKNPAKSQKASFWPHRTISSSLHFQKWCSSQKTSSGETSKIWRFLSRKKRKSLKKCQKSQETNISTLALSSRTSVFEPENSVTQGVGNSKSCSSSEGGNLRWGVSGAESACGVSSSRANTSQVLDDDSDSFCPHMSNSAYEKSSDFVAASGVEWRKRTSGSDPAVNKTRSGSRSCLFMESIGKVKKGNIRLGHEILVEGEGAGESPSSLTVWQRKAKCRAEKQSETFGGIGISGTDEVKCSKALSTSNSTLPTAAAAVHSPSDKTKTATITTATTTSSINRNSSETVGEGGIKTVHGIVASLIRAAEETRFHAPDKPKFLKLSTSRIQQEQTSFIDTTTSNLQQQETGTQTSPYLLSRSSSFDWINESSAEDEHCEDLFIVTPTDYQGTLEDPGYSIPNCADSPTMHSYDNDLTQEQLDRIADEEVQGMLCRNEQGRRQLAEERNILASKDIDDSIAMLLEYAGNLNVAPNREAPYPVNNESFVKIADDLQKNTSKSTSFAALRGLQCDVSRSKTLSGNNKTEFFRRFTSTETKNNAGYENNSSRSAVAQFMHASSSQGSMNDSIYDNVPHGFRRPKKSSELTLRNNSIGIVTTTNTTTEINLSTNAGAPLATVEPFNKDSSDSTPSSAETMNHCSIRSYGTKSDDISQLSNGTTLPQHDSISSGLADSESSPLSPDVHRNGGGDQKQLLNVGNRNKFRVAAVEINSPYELDKSISCNIRSPPPPSPRSVTEKRHTSVVGASDLCSFSTGRVPARAESCEELDVSCTEQTSDDLFSQKKQKVEEEAVECVRWLRDAGFPQYARLYEEHRFPIDIRLVQRDHEFLDDNSLRALFRRLSALNRCAIMKVENVVLRKHPQRFDVNPLETDIDDDMVANNYDDDEDQVAISNKWKYQRNSQTWSRIVCDNDTVDTFNNDNLLLPYRQEVPVVELGDALHASDYANDSRRQQDGVVITDIDAYNNQNQHNATANANGNNRNRSLAISSAAAAANLQRSQSERLRERARALMKRMDIRSSSRRRRQHGTSVASSASALSPHLTHSSSTTSPKSAPNATSRNLVIGDPVLVSHFSASPRTMHMFPDGISSILSSQAVTPQMLRQFRCDGTNTVVDDHVSDGVTFAVLQPTIRQQQQQQKKQHLVHDYETMVSQYNSTSPSFPSHARFLGASNRRIGLVMDSSTVSAGTATSNPQRRQLRRSKFRDVSCDPSLIRGLSGHNRTARIYDEVAQDDLYCTDNSGHVGTRRGHVDLVSRKHYDRHSALMFTEKPPSPERFASNTCFSTIKRSGSQFSGNVLSDGSLNCEKRGSFLEQDLENDRERNLAPEQSYSRSRLIVNADGYYEHIPATDVHGTSLEVSAIASNLDDSMTDGIGSSAISAPASGSSYHRTVSPTSSSSNASISNHATRLKVDSDRGGGKRLVCRSDSPSSNAVINISVAQRSHSSLESSGNDDDVNGRQHRSIVGERRDSGVGSSLSRSPSGPTTQRQRNSLLPPTLHVRDLKAKYSSPNSLFRADHSETFISDADLPQCMDALSVAEMQQLRKLAFLKLSVMIETYAGNGVRIGVVANNATGRVMKSWAVHKFIRRMRNNDIISGNKPPRTEISTFGLPLSVVQSCSGFALPRCVLEMMHFLRTVAPDTVGIFRKSGLRSRITELRMLCDNSPEAEVFTDGKELDSSQVHDIADLLKQYFRELPEPLMTSKYSEAFATIFLHVPVDLRLEALQHAVLLLPDEHREALQTLLYFLHDVAKHSDTNSMTTQNLAVCFVPSLFQLCGSRLNNISPTRRHKTIGAAGLPTESEIKESRAAQECLVYMIEHCTKLFLVPPSPGLEHDGIGRYCKGSEPDAPFLTELGSSQDGNYKSYLLQKARELLKEHRDRWKGWIVEGTVNGAEISTKKPTDGHPLRFFRVWVDIEAPPKEILVRIIRERGLWDVQTINWRIVATLNTENCDIFQYVINDTPSHPTRDAMVVRLWRTDMKELRGGCVLVERSVHSSETQLLGGLPVAVLASQFLVEPIAGRSRVTYITRTDLRGRSNVWYSKVYGQLIARQLVRLRDSFKQFAHVDDGPETKV